MQKLIIDELKKAARSELKIYGGARSNGKSILLGYRKGLEDAVTIVNSVIKQYNNGWIPCSERLPDTEENKNYLVCGSKGGIYIAEFVCKTIDGKTDIGPWWSARGRYCPNPIAWQPLPESYKEGES